MDHEWLTELVEHVAEDESAEDLAEEGALAGALEIFGREENGEDPVRKETEVESFAVRGVGERWVGLVASKNLGELEMRAESCGVPRRGEAVV